MQIHIDHRGSWPSCRPSSSSSLSGASAQPDDYLPASADRDRPPASCSQSGPAMLGEEPIFEVLCLGRRRRARGVTAGCSGTALQPNGSYADSRWSRGPRQVDSSPAPTPPGPRG